MYYVLYHICIYTYVVHGSFLCVSDISSQIDNLKAKRIRRKSLRDQYDFGDSSNKSECNPAAYFFMLQRHLAMLTREPLRRVQGYCKDKHFESIS